MYYRTMFDVLQLEQLIIPGINAQIRDIRSVLDQRALEEVTVLKRIKNKLEKRGEAVAA
jgi:V/A-type H+/Na+-transporting ATPase subunit D